MFFRASRGVHAIMTRNALPWLLLASLLLCFTPAPVVSQNTDADKDRIEAGVKRGVDFLKKAQWHFMDMPAQPGLKDQHDVGVAALCGLALLESEVPRTIRACSRLASGETRRAQLGTGLSRCVAIMFLTRAQEDPAHPQLTPQSPRRTARGRGLDAQLPRPHDRSRTCVGAMVPRP